MYLVKSPWACLYLFGNLNIIEKKSRQAGHNHKNTFLAAKADRNDPRNPWPVNFPTDVLGYKKSFKHDILFKTAKKHKEQLVYI